MTHQLIFFLSALGAFNGFILAIYFAINANKKKIANYFLAFLLLTLSLRIIKSVFFYYIPELSNVFIQIGLSACLLIGPFLYLYLKSQTINQKTNWQLHTLPFILGITVLGLLYPYVEHREVWSRWIVKVIYLQWFIYIALSTRNILPIFSKIKRKEKLKNIDVWLLSIFFGVAIIWLAYATVAYTSYILGAISFTFVVYLIVLLLIFKNRQASSFFEEKEKYKNKEMDETIIEDIEQKINLIEERELYLNPSLTIDETAKELEISKHLLSQYLNEKLGKSFTNYINEFRINRAKELLKSQTNYTVESIGYDCGFNSKSTFFTAFRKITGKTPAEYQKMSSNL